MLPDLIFGTLGTTTFDLGFLSGVAVFGFAFGASLWESCFGVLGGYYRGGFCLELFVPF